MIPRSQNMTRRKSESILIEQMDQSTIPEKERKEQASWKERIEQSQRDKEQERKRGR